MAHGRAYHNLTLLPDGTVLASGGGSRSDGVDAANAVLPAEIWNPDTETWTTVDSLTNGRLYHSTALLLPDGRVLMAGGGALPGSIAVNQRNAEIYSPPYLFKGATTDDHRRTGDDAVRRDVRRHDAGRRSDRARLPDPLALGHACDRHEPALPVPQLHAGRRQGDRARRRRTRTSRRPATTCSSSSTRTACRRWRRSCARRRPADTTPPTVAMTAPAAGRHGLGHGLRHCDRRRQRRDRRRAVQARRREPRRRGHHCAVQRLLGHPDGDQRLSFADGCRT